MFRKALLTVAAVMAVFVLHSTAKADPFTLTQGQSVTVTFTHPNYPGSSATATVTLSGSQLTLNVTNTSTDGTTRLKGIGISTTPNLTLASSNPFTASGGMSAFSYSSNGGGLGNMEAIASSNGHSTLNQGLNNTGTVVFNLASAPQTLTIDQITVHLISLPDGESIKPNGDITNVPEPMTMLLFGTGLAGIAARARRRRASKA